MDDERGGRESRQALEGGGEETFALADLARHFLDRTSHFGVFPDVVDEVRQRRWHGTFRHASAGVPHERRKDPEDERAQDERAIHAARHRAERVEYRLEQAFRLFVGGEDRTADGREAAAQLLRFGGRQAKRARGILLGRKRQKKPVVLVPLGVRDEMMPHVGLREAMDYVKMFQPEHVIFNHMASECDYDYVNTHTPDYVEPAYDGLKVEW